MRYALIIPLLLATFCLADDPLENTRKINEQIEALDKATPVVQKVRELQLRISKIDQAVEEERSKLYEELINLQHGDAWDAYLEKRSALEAQRQEKWQVERRTMAEAAKKLYSSRHQELRGRQLQQTPQLRALGLDVLTYPRVNGSTSTHPLAVILASRALDVPYEWLYPEPQGYRSPDAPFPEEFFLPGGAALQPASWDDAVELQLAASRVTAKPDDRDPRQLRQAMMINSLLASNDGTHESYEQLIGGKADLILVARGPSEDELKKANESGVKIETRPVALDAMVFIVNHQNDLKGLTLDEIRTLYRNTFTREERPGRGDAVGVAGRKLTPLMRDRNSGSRELFDDLVMKGEQLPEGRWVNELYSNSMAGPFNRVTTQKDALGYTVYYYDRFMSMSPYTRTIAINGVEPNAETIASGAYPMVTPVYAAYRANEPADAPAMKLLNWLLSDEGQAVVRESGYVPVKRGQARKTAD